MNTESKTEHIPHSTQFELLTRKLLCLFSACGVIPSLSREEIEHYAALAGFHDIGKGTIPPEILNKPAPLTAEEFAVMKTHTTAGCKLLRESPEFSGSDDLPLLCDVCRHHHERGTAAVTRRACPGTRSRRGCRQWAWRMPSTPFSTPASTSLRFPGRRQYG